MVIPMNTKRSTAALRATVSAVVFVAVLSPTVASADKAWVRPGGTWYLALDAQPYTGIPGINLPGLVSLHSDRTMQIVDGGDFGGLPFATRDTTQLGSWDYGRSGIRAVTLFLQADGGTGDVRAWFRVSMELRFKDANTLEGKVNVAKLDCLGPAPFPVFNCPDPIEHAGDFQPDGPPDVPVILRRLRVPMR
jgi:hypothetical protein